MGKIVTAFRVFLSWALILGIIYPGMVMILARGLLPWQADGSLVKLHGKIVGSKLIAQEFTLPAYFHSRFSAAAYDATNSRGSNWVLSRPEIYPKLQERIQRLQITNHFKVPVKFPADMVLSSASGLDPHISLENALLQLPRVANQRKLTAQVIKNLIYSCVDDDFIGIWGEAGVNVLSLNLALDQLEVGR